MMDANVVMEEFMEKLNGDGFRKENMPNDGPVIDVDFINTQLLSYSKLLESGIINAALDDDNE